MAFKSYHTFNEILGQPDSWKQVYKDIVEEETTSSKLLKKDYDQIILFGCGSSYNLSQSASVFSRYISEKINSIALPSSELLLNHHLYIRDSKKYLLVGFSRSGETTETVEVLNNMKDKKNIDLFTFTCNKNSSFAKISSKNFICNNAMEKSIVMTTSFSSMLFAYCSFLANDAENSELLSELCILVTFIEDNIDSVVSFTDNYVKEVDFSSYFVLGSGFNYGLAVEADLKMKEMSQIPSYSYHIHEFSHGPKSLLNDKSLCLVLTPGKKIDRYEKTLKEFTELGTCMLIIGNNPIPNLKNTKTSYFLDGEAFKNEMVGSFINIPVFQLMAFFKTLKNKLNPDLPKNLSYTVKI
jgi:glucosamine--fructose-6-phosphate aminotransferase (isomerizing)